MFVLDESHYSRSGKPRLTSCVFLEKEETDMVKPECTRPILPAVPLDNAGFLLFFWVQTRCRIEYELGNQLSENDPSEFVLHCLYSGVLFYHTFFDSVLSPLFLAGGI